MDVSAVKRVGLDSRAKNKLIVFDVEGILIPKVRFVLFEVAKRMGLWSFIKAALYGLLYEIGLIPLKKALENLYRLFRGVSLDKFISLFCGIPLMPGVETVFEELKEAGFKIALISSGIPRVALEKLDERLRADYVSGLEIGLSEGLLTGDIWGDVIEPKGKAVALRKILSDESLSPCYCIVVADDRNNLPMFQLCDLKIGYNPDFILTYKSDHIVKGDLSRIIPIVKGEYIKRSNHRLSESRIIREAIHISGFFVAIACTYLLNRYIVALLIFLVTVLYTTSEFRRMFGVSLPIITGITLKAAGKSEVQEFVASPIFYALGIFLSLTLFPEPIGYVSIAVLTLGDGFAAIFGEKFGITRIPFNKAKRLEGTFCGFIFAFLGSLIFVDPLRALVASLVGMVTEVVPLPLNDNLVIPLASGIALLAARPVFL